MRYQKTMHLTKLSQLNGLQIGQWFTLHGNRGQWLGTTKQGAGIVAWHHEGQKINQAQKVGKLAHYVRSTY